MSQTIYLLLGDCRERSEELRAERGDGFLWAMVGDPPYDLTSGSGGGFMGRAWDATGVAFDETTWEEVFKALEPGGVIKVFSATRTYHRMVRAIEQAGFVDIRLESWVQGEGFPKGLNISKALDKLAGAEREVIGTQKLTGTARTLKGGNYAGGAYTDGKEPTDSIPLTAPSTDAAKRWEGYNVSLKPSWEPIVIARRPL